MKNILPLARIFLGLFLIVYALNHFFHFLPTSYGEMPDNTKNFLDAVVMYLPALYVFEILIGMMLLLNKWTPFISIVLIPLSLAFLIFVISNGAISDMWPAFIVAFLNAILFLSHKEKYATLFKKD